MGNRKAHNMLQLLLQIQSMTLEVGEWHAGKVKDERTAFLVVHLCHSYQDDRRWDAWGRLSARSCMTSVTVLGPTCNCVCDPETFDTQFLVP